MNTHRATLFLLLAACAAFGASSSPITQALAPPEPRFEAGLASLTGPPSTWLAGADKREEWKAATPPRRELLQRLDLPAPLVQKYLCAQPR